MVSFGDISWCVHDKAMRLRRALVSVQEELLQILPRIDRLLRGDTFDPATAQDRFRLCCPTIVAPVRATPDGAPE